MNIEKKVDAMEKGTPDAIKDYDFTLEQEVLSEYAAGIWADYVSYCNSHGIDIGDKEEPMAARTQLVYEYKRKIIETGECKSLEDLEPIKHRLKEMKDYLIKVREKE